MYKIPHLEKHSQSLIYKSDMEKSESFLNCKSGNTYRIVFMGSSGVGKSTILSQIIEESYDRQYKATIDEIHHADYEINGKPLKLELLDTSGTDEFPAMREIYIRSADAFILVYSVDKPDSWEKIEHIRNQINEIRSGDCVPIAVVANKVDLCSEEDGHLLTQSVESFDLDVNIISMSAVNCISATNILNELFKQAKRRFSVDYEITRRRNSLRAIAQKQKHGCVIC